MSGDDGKDSGNKVNVDAGLKVALKSIGVEEVPKEVSQSEYEELSGKVSQGLRLRMEQKAKEQNMMMMWKSRVNLVKQARQLMIQKAFPEAAVAYEKYLRVLEMVYELPSGGLSPDVFNRSQRSKELTVITSVYWDLVRIYDSTKAYQDRQQKAARKLVEFLPYSTIFPQLVKHAQSFQKSSKNPQVIRGILKSVKANKGGCYVATCVYQDGFHPSVNALRVFRDEQLSRLPGGPYFIRFYYLVSPHLVIHLQKFPRIQGIIRKTLDIFVSKFCR